MITCAADDTQHESVEALHAHLKKRRLKQETYYHQHNPRRDKLTGELIPFKDYQQYHTQDFATKTNLKRWLKEHREEGLAWSIEWLKRRKEEKSLVYAPSQVEMRTAFCPSIPYYETVGKHLGGWNGIAASLGLAARFVETEPIFTLLPPDAVIIEDTREQDPLRLVQPTRRVALEVGDYALAAPHDLGIRIERKSLNDFAGTMSGRQTVRKGKTKTTIDSSLARFTRELARAADSRLYVVMMVEVDINEAQAINHLPHMRHVKASASYLMRNLRDLLTKFPLTFQAVFVDGRRAMSEKVMRVFQMGKQVKRVDLQLAVEEGKL